MDHKLYNQKKLYTSPYPDRKIKMTPLEKARWLILNRYVTDTSEEELAKQIKKAEKNNGSN